MAATVATTLLRDHPGTCGTCLRLIKTAIRWFSRSKNQIDHRFTWPATALIPAIRSLDFQQTSNAFQLVAAKSTFAPIHLVANAELSAFGRPVEELIPVHLGRTKRPLDQIVDPGIHIR